MNYFTKKLIVFALMALLALIFFLGFESRNASHSSDLNTTDLNSSAPNNKQSESAEVIPSESKVQDRVEVQEETHTKTPEQIKLALESKLNVEVDSIEKSPIDGFYQAFLNGDLVYISSTGHHLMAGNLLDLTKQRPINLSQIAIQKQEAKLAPKRAELIANVNEADMVVYKAKQEKYEITIFTDVDCGYCRRLHQEVAKLIGKGVSVRYMAYPRAGLGSASHKKLESIWCAKDRLAAMDAAKLQGQFSPGNCQDQLAEQYYLSQALKLSGTPAIILSNGEIIGGYLPAEQLFAELQKRS